MSAISSARRPTAQPWCRLSLPSPSPSSRSQSSSPPPPLSFPRPRPSPSRSPVVRRSSSCRRPVVVFVACCSINQTHPKLSNNKQQHQQTNTQQQHNKGTPRITDGAGEGRPTRLGGRSQATAREAGQRARTSERAAMAWTSLGRGGTAAARPIAFAWLAAARISAAAPGCAADAPPQQPQRRAEWDADGAAHDRRAEGDAAERAARVARPAVDRAAEEEGLWRRRRAARASSPPSLTSAGRRARARRRRRALGADVVVKVRPPSDGGCQLRRGAAFIYPAAALNKAVVEKLRAG